MNTNAMSRRPGPVLLLMALASLACSRRAALGRANPSPDAGLDPAPDTGRDLGVAIDTSGSPAPDAAAERPMADATAGAPDVVAGEPDAVALAPDAPVDRSRPDLSRADHPPEPDSGCGARLLSDPANCGACGHSCQGGACFDGFCQTRSLGSRIGSDVHGMAVDDTAVYLSEYERSGRVLRIPLSDGEPFRVLADGQKFPQGLALDATHVYWANWTEGEQGEINRVPTGGGPIQVLAPRESGPQQVAVDDTHVYWTTQGSSGAHGVWRVIKTGGTPEKLATADSPSGVALDASHVYWCEWGAGTVNRRAKAGGRVEVLATGEPDAHRLALDGQRVYWSSSLHIASVPKAGGAITTVASTFNAQDVAVAPDGDGVYWATSFELESWRRGGILRLLDGGGLAEIEVRGGWVYFVTSGSLLRVPR